jgi:hypothetical protein
MHSFEFFDAFDYAILSLIVAAAFLALLLIRKRIHKRAAENRTGHFKRTGWIHILAGGLLLLVSVTGWILLERHHERAIGFFRPVSIMTNEPFVVLSAAAFAAGLVLVLTGSHYVKLSRDAKTRP